MNGLEIWAHRGGRVDTPSGIPSGNTFLSFKSALDAGVDGIEADACLSADEKVIIYHPESLNPDLTELTWRDIQSLHRSYIMNLDNLLYFLGGCKNLQCCLDIKQHSDKLLEQVVNKIIKAELQDRIYITAPERRIDFVGLHMDGSILIRAKKINPAVKTHLMAIFPFNLLSLKKKFQADAISIGWVSRSQFSEVAAEWFFNVCHPEFYDPFNLKRQIRKIKKSGTKIWAGVFNEKKDMQRFIEMGVEGIFTDDIETALKLKWEIQMKNMCLLVG